MNEIVSIIVPVYNVEAYLPKCIESLVHQTYTNLEIILIDDGSTDTSGKICDEYAKSDSRIQVVHKENGGVSDTRNVGLDHVNGSYIMFVDSDDFIDEKMVEILYQDLIEQDADISQCNYYRIDENGVVTPSGFAPKKFLLEGEEKYHYLNAPEYRMLYAFSAIKMCKKEVFHGIRYPKGRIHEDVYVIYDIVKNAKRISCRYDLYLYYYLQRSTSITHTFNRGRFDVLDAIWQRQDKFEKNSVFYFENLQYYFIKVSDALNQSRYYHLKEEKKKYRQLQRRVYKQLLENPNLNRKEHLMNWLKVYTPVHYIYEKYIWKNL